MHHVMLHLGLAIILARSTPPDSISLLCLSLSVHSRFISSYTLLLRECILSLLHLSAATRRGYPQGR
jgi:hypothetical protein